jgi:Fur family ferric uptake transcriptional regulator
MCNGCQCKGLLQRKRIAITELRRYVIKVLTQAKSSLTASAILQEIRKMRSINKVTLYRILALLEDKEVVRSILTSTGIIRYALIDPQNRGMENLPPQFICRKCKAIMPIDFLNGEIFIKKILNSKFSGPFELVIEGVCSKCRKEKYA